LGQKTKSKIGKDISVEANKLKKTPKRKTAGCESPESRAMIVENKEQKENEGGKCENSKEKKTVTGELGACVHERRITESK